MDDPNDATKVDAGAGPDDTERSEAPYFEVDAEHGVSWEALEAIARSPKRLVANTLNLVLDLRRQPNMRSTLQLAAKRLKATEAQIAQCLEHVPRLIEVGGNGRTLRLLSEAPPPWVVDPATMKEIEREAKIAEKKRLAREARQRTDEADTPFNALRRGIEALGLDRDTARDTTGYLVRHYGIEQTRAALDIATQNKPGDPKPYLIGILRKGVATSGHAGSARSTPRTTRPDGTGKTTLIGWEDRLVEGVRHKLYRKPDGSLRREAPLEGETIPTTAQDPGYRVAA